MSTPDVIVVDGGPPKVIEVQLPGGPPGPVGPAGPPGPQGPPGSSSAYTAIWRWTTAFDASASGRVGLNAANWATATQVNLNETTAGGGDASNALARLEIGDGFYLQQKDDANRWGHYTITAAGTDHGTWWSWPISLVNASEPPPANNADTNVSLLIEGGLTIADITGLQAALDAKLDKDAGAATIEDLSVSGYLPSPAAAYAAFPLYVAPFPCRIASFWLTPTATVAASDTTYWNARLLRRPGKFAGPPSYIPAGSPATTDGYYRTMILAEPNLLDYYVLNETSGTTAADSKTPANNATYQVAATTGIRGAPGVQDGSGNEFAYSYDGTTSAVVTPSYSLPWAAGGAYELWLFIAPGSWDNTTRCLIGGENTVGIPHLKLIGGTAPNGTVANGLVISIPGANVIMTDTQFPGVEPGEWHHIVYQRTSGAASDTSHQFWLDNVLLSNATGFAPTTAFLSTATAHGIGRRAAGSEPVPAGTRIAHVAFYNAPLSQAQIARHYGYGYEFLHKTTRARDGETFTGWQGWATEAFTVGPQATFAAGDTAVLELEPFGTPATPGPLGYGLRVEPL